MKQRPLVVDASALGNYLLGTDEGERVGGSLVRFEADLNIPEICDVEVLAILRRALRAGELTLDRATDAIVDLLDLPLARHRHLPSVGRIFQLRDNFSPYDATYVALAERLNASLITTDRRLARAIRDHLELDLIDASLH